MLMASKGKSSSMLSLFISGQHDLPGSHSFDTLSNRAICPLVKINIMTLMLRWQAVQIFSADDDRQTVATASSQANIITHTKTKTICRPSIFHIQN